KDRSPIERAERGDRDGVGESERDEHHEEREDAEIFTKEDLAVRDGHREQKFDGAGAFFLGDESHRKGRSGYDEDRTEEIEHLAEACAIVKEKGLPKKEAEREENEREDDIGGWAVEEATELP